MMKHSEHADGMTPHWQFISVPADTQKDILIYRFCPVCGETWVMDTISDEWGMIGEQSDA